MNYWTQSPGNIFVAAHRGWRSAYPENTLAAFKAALEIGVDQLETDVRMTKDGVLVLIHDETVDRTTNGNGRVCDFTFEELRRLDAGNGTQIPTLTEFMELVKKYPDITIDIELKEYPFPGIEARSYDICDRVLALVDSYGFNDRCIINTLNARLHEYIKKKYGNKYKQHVFYPLRIMGEYTKNPYEYAYCTCIFGIHQGKVTVDEVKRLHEQTGIRIWAGAYVKDEASVDLAIAMGAELITCDNPDTVLEILRKKRLHK
ncbi:MAG: hypothetical protein IKD04_09685 [Clostridia bacterium]|nr:hypothetical protein [Clostridia bacterium]